MLALVQQKMARMMRVVLLCAVAVAAVSGHSLNKGNYEELSAGKTAFIKFQAPWCVLHRLSRLSQQPRAVPRMQPAFAIYSDDVRGGKKDERRGCAVGVFYLHRF